MLSVGIIAGFLAALSKTIYEIAANKMIHFGMFRYVLDTSAVSVNFFILFYISGLCLSAAAASSFGALRILLNKCDSVKSALNTVIILSLLPVFSYYLPAVKTGYIKFFIVPAVFFSIIRAVYYLKLSHHEKGKMKAGAALNVTGLALCLFVSIVNAWQYIDNKLNPPAGPSIIMITVDTLRADHLGCYGYKRDTTAYIDQLSSESLVFKNAIAPSPWTTPSVAAMFTAQYPGVLGYSIKPVKLNNEFLTIAEMLRNSNYRTKGIISHSLISSDLGFSQGFDSYDEENSMGHGHVSSPSITEKALEFIKKHGKRKFFLFLHYFDPHFDFRLHEEFDYYSSYNGFIKSGQRIQEIRARKDEITEDDLNYIKALYDSEISFTDKYIGQIMEHLKKAGLYENVLIILTADHGEEFMERKGRWIGHCNKLYQEQIHVPLIIKLPGHSEQKIIRDYVSLVDIMPTILHKAGINIPENYNMQGRVMHLNGAERFQRMVFSETHRSPSYKLALIDNGWKYIYEPDLGRERLFDLRNDPREKFNLAAEEKKRSGNMNSALRAWGRQILHLRPANVKEHDFTEEQKEQLKTLGYLQ